jgi:AraC family transcriptional regulator, regulatory protein of adaptative response / methylphosphotriester-DNA alkyltransferase methyltransferase
MAVAINLSFEEMWEKIIACDPKYDGLFFTAVKTTKIYCRPSCRSRKPKKINVKFYHESMKSKRLVSVLAKDANRKLMIP